MTTTRQLLAVTALAAALPFAAAPANAFDITFAIHTTPPGPEFEAVDRFIELVGERSDGRITVTTFPGAVLGGERDNIEQLTVGEVAMTLNGDLLPSLLAAEYAPTVIPFVFPSPEEVFSFWDSEVGQQAKDVISERGSIHVAGFFRRGSRHLTANREVRTPEDLAGLKLRVPEIPTWVAVWGEMGAQPTPVAWPEVFSSLQVGVVDGQENPCFNIHQARLYEVQDYVIYTGHVAAVWHWSVSERFLDGLSEEDRELVLGAIAEAAAYGDEVTQEQIETTCTMLEEELGMTPIEPDHVAMRAAALPAVERLAEEWAPGVFEAVAKYFD